ncbi:MAG: PilZ domain-containing protein [Myxococcota bacterium]|nr:PilZ domain-containing protein [Myxococcota bacterium]
MGKLEAKGGGSRRYLIRFPVEVLREGETEPFSLESDYVGAGGMFLRAKDEVSAGDVIFAKMRLPLGVGTVCLKGSAAVNEASSVSGVAVTWGSGQEEALGRWSEFVTAVSEMLEGETLESFAGAGAPVGPESRSHHRFGARLKVRFANTKDMKKLYTSAGAESEDVSQGGMFVRVQSRWVVGDRVEIQAVHPTTHESFLLQGMIRWMGRKSGKVGVGVEFLPIERSELEAFQTFIKKEVAEAGTLD